MWFALITAGKWCGIESTKLAVTRGKFQTMQREGLSGLHSLKCFLRTSTSSRLHRFSITFISGDWGGVKSLQGALYSRNFQVRSAVCFGSSSCQKWKQSFKSNLRALVFKLVCKISTYIIAVICPSMNTKFPTPLTVMQLHTSTLPTQNFTVGSKFLVCNSQFFFSRHSRIHPI